MKKFTLILLIALLALTGFVFSTTLAQGQLQSVDVSIDSDAANQKFLETINKYQALSFSLDIFDRPDYKELRDFTTVISPEPVGRENPFAPLQGGAVNTGSGPNFSSVNSSSTKN